MVLSATKTVTSEAETPEKITEVRWGNGREAILSLLRVLD